MDDNNDNDAGDDYPEINKFVRNIQKGDFEKEGALSIHALCTSKILQQISVFVQKYMAHAKPTAIASHYWWDTMIYQ